VATTSVASDVETGAGAQPATIATQTSRLITVKLSFLAVNMIFSPSFKLEFCGQIEQTWGVLPITSNVFLIVFLRDISYMMFGKTFLVIGNIN
jgi:hypothetical protein